MPTKKPLPKKKKTKEDYSILAPTIKKLNAAGMDSSGRPAHKRNKKPTTANYGMGDTDKTRKSQAKAVAKARPSKEAEGTKGMTAAEAAAYYASKRKKKATTKKY